MVHGVPVIGVLIPLKEGEFGDPEEIEFSFGDEIQLFAENRPDSAERRQNHLVFVSAEQGHIALLQAESGNQRV